MKLNIKVIEDNVVLLYDSNWSNVLAVCNHIGTVCIYGQINNPLVVAFACILGKSIREVTILEMNIIVTSVSLNKERLSILLTFLKGHIK